MKWCAVLALAFLAVAAAQPFTFEQPVFEPELAETAKRIAINYTGFTYDFNTAEVSLSEPHIHRISGKCGTCARS